MSHIRKNKNMYLEVEIEKAECEPDYGQLSYQLEVEDNWYYWDHRGDEDDSDWRSRKSRNVEYFQQHDHGTLRNLNFEMGLQARSGLTFRLGEAICTRIIC